MINFNKVSRNRYGFSGIHALPDRRHLITGSTVQGLSLNDNERKETMNSYNYILTTVDSHIVMVHNKFISKAKEKNGKD